VVPSYIAGIIIALVLFTSALISSVIIYIYRVELQLIYKDKFGKFENEGSLVDFDSKRASFIFLAIFASVQGHMMCSSATIQKTVQIMWLNIFYQH
jgi:hypothetical protein